MSKRAEDLAVEYQIKTHGPNVMGGTSVLSEDEYMRLNMNYDFKAGCEQAEKDLALTAEGVGCIGDDGESKNRRVMTREEAYNTLVRMRAWRKWGRGEQNEEDRPPIVSQKEVDEALDVFIETLKTHTFPEGLDEAAEKFNREDAARMWDYEGKTEGEIVEAAVKAGAEWAFGQGVTVGGTIINDKGYPTELVLNTYLSQYADREEVIVQIRKK